MSTFFFFFLHTSFFEGVDYANSYIVNSQLNDPFEKEKIEQESRRQDRTAVRYKEEPLGKSLYLKAGMYVLSRFSCVQLFVTPWTVALQTPLSMGFSRQARALECVVILSSWGSS